jgi:hypothetical protein
MVTYNHGLLRVFCIHSMGKKNIQNNYAIAITQDPGKGKYLMLKKFKTTIGKHPL